MRMTINLRKRDCSRRTATTVSYTHLPFTELLEAVKKKFRETARFWGSAQMTLTLEGRRLSPEEEFSVVNAITENYGIEILCLIDADAERIRRCEKALNEKLMELSASTGQFYKGNLRNGDVLESEASIVVIGDVDCGARVSAKGNIIILGTLKGTAQAGLSGNRNAVVVAMEMAPSQVRISDLAFQKAEKGRLLGWGPMMILVKMCIRDRGVEVLSDAELLAVILRTGTKDISARALAEKILTLGDPPGLPGLLHHCLLYTSSSTWNWWISLGLPCRISP